MTRLASVCKSSWEAKDADLQHKATALESCSLISAEKVDPNAMIGPMAILLLSNSHVKLSHFRILKPNTIWLIRVGEALAPSAWMSKPTSKTTPRPTTSEVSIVKHRAIPTSRTHLTLRQSSNSSLQRDSRWWTCLPACKISRKLSSDRAVLRGAAGPWEATTSQSLSLSLSPSLAIHLRPNLTTKRFLKKSKRCREVNRIQPRSRMVPEMIIVMMMIHGESMEMRLRSMIITDLSHFGADNLTTLYYLQITWKFALKNIIANHEEFLHLLGVLGFWGFGVFC